MEDILRLVLENLVEEKAKVSIERKDDDYKVLFNVRVAEKDMGKVIGKQGKIAQSIRTLMKAVGAKEQKKVDVEFLD